MARGRFVSSEITKDKRINDLSDDTSRLAFTWLITFADSEGRTFGDPALVRSILFPRRSDISIEQMETYIREWAELGLVQWYKAANDLWIFFPAFDKHQVGLRKDREAPSTYPPPPTDSSVLTPDQLLTNSDENAVKLSLSESKLSLSNDDIPSEESNTPYRGLFYAYYEAMNQTPRNPSKRDVDSLNRMVSDGIISTDVKTGVLDLKAKGYKMVGPASIENAARFAKDNRTNVPHITTPGEEF